MRVTKSKVKSTTEPMESLSMKSHSTDDITSNMMIRRIRKAAEQTLNTSPNLEK